MIVFLTLCYCAALALLIKLKVLKPTLTVKLSPIAWLLLLLVVLFIPMMSGAPSGEVRVYQYMVQIAPRVGGRVVAVPVKPNVPVEKGDVLFRIDPEPYQIQVDRLEAALVEAKQTAKTLEATLASAKASVARARARLAEAQQDSKTLKASLDAARAGVAKAKASLAEARQNAKMLKTSLDAAKAVVAKAETQRNLSKAQFERASKLLRTDVASQNDFDRAQAEFRSAEASLLEAQASEAQAQLAHDSTINGVNTTVAQRVAALAEAQASEAQAQLAYDSKIGGVNTTVAQREAELREAEAGERKAQLAVESEIGGENTTVARTRAELSAAKLDLAETTIYAPTDGFVTNLQLREGFVVAAGAPVMTFIDDSQSQLIALIYQTHLGHVKPGHSADVVLSLYPGKTLRATVHSIVWATGQGQMAPGGALPELTQAQPAGRFAVRLQIADESANLRLPAGAAGSVAIYTDSMKFTHILRRVMMRMDTWLNYIFAS